MYRPILYIQQHPIPFRVPCEQASSVQGQMLQMWLADSRGWRYKALWASQQVPSKSYVCFLLDNWPTRLQTTDSVFSVCMLLKGGAADVISVVYDGGKQWKFWPESRCARGSDFMIGCHSRLRRWPRSSTPAATNSHGQSTCACVLVSSIAAHEWLALLIKGMEMQ